MECSEKEILLTTQSSDLMRMKESIQIAMSMINKTIDQSLTHTQHTQEHKTSQIPSNDPQSLAASLISLAASVSSEVTRSQRCVAVAEDQMRRDSLNSSNIMLRAASLERDLGKYCYVLSCWAILYSVAVLFLLGL